MSRIVLVENSRHSKLSPRGFTLLELIVVLAIVGILFALLIPAVLDAREAARRTQCRSYFKHHAIALHNYLDVNGVFPPAYTIDEDGKPLHSWRTLILPFFEQSDIYDSLDLSKPWDDPVNTVEPNLDIRYYQCPSIELPAFHTTYLGIVGENHAFNATHGRPISDFVDGLDHTGMVLEVSVDYAVHWMSPQDTDGEYLVGFTEELNFPHDRSMHLNIADGTCVSINPDLPIDERKSLVTISKSENDEDN